MALHLQTQRFPALLRAAVTGALIAFAGSGARALDLNNSSASYATLSGTTVNMSGRAELRITGNSAPLSGCTINLNSPEAYLYFTGIAPSAVNSTYLSQVYVNGSAAVNDSNCRVVQYADGTVVVPHAPNYAPLQVFTGTRFTGSSTNLTSYTGYTDSNLGAFANQISSFKLKRGYTATIAQNANGTGISKNYVAQDGDLEISVLPADLDNSVSFIRVFPWRWSSKKGIAGNIADGLNTGWWYNWNLDQTSNIDREYVPIRQLRWWPSLGQDWKYRGATHLLGYNEPDKADQANMTVGDAIWSWPDLLGTGLRVGSPATSDGGRSSWLYPFINQADAEGLRVDFVAVHYYWGYGNAADPAGAATQFYNYLKAVHDATGRPIWVTEWNNGASWTTTPVPTAAQQAATVAAMIDMLESTPWVERYAIYNWVGDTRRVKWDDGSLTSAGVAYRDKASNLAYSQVVPEAPIDPGATYRFENNASDTSAYGNAAILEGQAMYGAGKLGQGVALSGDSAKKDHVLLSPRLGDSADFTFSAWVYWTGGNAWQRVFDLGNDTASYMFLTPKSSTGKPRFAIKTSGGTEQMLDAPSALATNTWTHVAVTISGNTGKLFINGALVATNASMTYNPSDLGTTSNYLGKSQFSGDPYFAGTLDEVQFLPYALTDAQASALPANAPPQFASSTISGGNATQGVSYTGTIAGQASDPGDTITYSKLEGPEWLTVAASGALSGTPTFDDEGVQSFIVCATDASGATAYAELTITLPPVIGAGTWNTYNDGKWSEVAKWSSNFPANGAGNAANFVYNVISPTCTVTLDSARSIGRLVFADTSGTQSWALASTNGRTLTLDNSGASATITVSNNRATVSAPLAGTNGINKLGSGTLVLAGYNALSGTLNIDTGSTSAAEGITRLAHPGAAAGLGAINIRNNNTGSSTLELDGTNGPISSAAAITLSGRNGATVPVRNLSGSNTVGAVTIGSGGANYVFQADAGSLNSTGGFTSAATGDRTLTFQGAGDFSFAGPITLGSASNISIVKSGTGTLTFNGSTNTLGAGTLAVNGGGVNFFGAGGPGGGAISFGTNASLGLGRGGAISSTVTGPGAISNSGSCTITGDFSGFTGSYTHNTIYSSTAFNSSNATSKNAAYFLASAQGASQGFIAGGAGDHTLELGSLNGVAGSLFRGGNTVSGTTTLKVGNLGRSDTFAGTIANGTSKTIALTKTGTGTLTLSGTNTYTGPTLVEAGVLRVDGALGTNSVTVSSGATLGGAGKIAGPVNVLPGATLSPGSGTVGTLSASNNLTLGSSSVTRMEISRPSSDSLAVAGTLARGGALVVTNVGAALVPGDTFTLFSAAANTGAFASVTMPPLDPGFVWDSSGLTNGTGVVRVVADYSAYNTWVAGYAFPPGTSGDAGDPDGDGIANPAEWVFGGDPLTADAPRKLPVATIEPDIMEPGKKYLCITARVRKNLTGYRLEAQVATSLVSPNWSTSDIESYQNADYGDTEEIVWVYLPALGDVPGGQAYMRLRVVPQ